MPQTDILTAYRAKILINQRKISHGIATGRRKKMPKTKKGQLPNGDPQVFSVSGHGKQRKAIYLSRLVNDNLSSLCRLVKQLVKRPHCLALLCDLAVRIQVKGHLGGRMA